MRVVLMRLLGVAVVVAVALGPLAATVHARHIDADAIRGAAAEVAAAARSRDVQAVRDAVEDLVDLVAVRPEVPDEGDPEEGGTIGVQNVDVDLPEDADGVGLGVASAARSRGDVRAAVIELVGVVTSRPDEEDEEQ